MSTRKSQRVDLSASLNTTRRTQTKFSREKHGGATVVSTGISFTNPATIADSNNGFGAIAVRDTIQVRGSPKNSRVWEVVTAAAGSITVKGGTITSEIAGPSITVTRED